MDFTKNPFAPNDTDRHQIWTMLVERDIDAFLAGDWSKHGPDFHAESFFGVHAHKSELPDSWRLDFPNLETYRDEWLRQSAATAKVKYAEPLREALFRATNMRDIDIAGDRAVCHKKFDGVVARADGGQDVLSWQTLYFCGRFKGVWKMTGFVGYMPYPMGKARS